MSTIAVIRRAVPRRLTAALRRLRGRQSTRSRAEEAHRLATEASLAVERLLQAEVELWRAIDELREEAARSGRRRDATGVDG